MVGYYIWLNIHHLGIAREVYDRTKPSVHILFTAATLDAALVSFLPAAPRELCDPSDPRSGGPVAVFLRGALDLWWAKSESGHRQRRATVPELNLEQPSSEDMALVTTGMNTVVEEGGELEEGGGGELEEVGGRYDPAAEVDFYIPDEMFFFCDALDLTSLLTIYAVSSQVH